MTPGRSAATVGACSGRAPKSPSAPGRTTISTACDSSRRSGETSSNWMRSAIAASGRLGRHLARLGNHLVDRAHHVEGRFRQVVIGAGDDALEALDGLLEADQHARRAGEDLGDLEGLRQDALEL